MPKRYRVYTGPIIVQEVAHRLQERGFNVYCEGTQHVYVYALGPSSILTALGVTGFSYKDIMEMK